MKCMVGATDLSLALKIVEPAVPKRAVLPILQNVCLRARGARLYLSGTDLDRHIETYVLARVSEEGETTVPHRLLTSTLKRREGFLRMETEGNALRLKNGGTFTLQGIPAEDFPSAPPGGIDPTETWPPESEAVREGLEAVTFAASKDETRPVLCGVHWAVSERGTRMEASDGHRIAQWDFGEYEPLPDNGKAGVILPTATAKMLLHLFRTHPTLERVERIGEEHISFRLGPTTLCSRLIESPYVDVPQVMNGPRPMSAVFSIAQLRSALEEAKEMVSQVNHHLVFAFSPGRVVLSGKSENQGTEFHQILPCSTAEIPEEWRIGFNLLYLREILAHTEAETVRFLFSSPVSSTLIEPVGKKKQRFLLMPLREDK